MARQALKVYITRLRHFVKKLLVPLKVSPLVDFILSKSFEVFLQLILVTNWFV